MGWPFWFINGIKIVIVPTSENGLVIRVTEHCYKWYILKLSLQNLVSRSKFESKEEKTILIIPSTN